MSQRWVFLSGRDTFPSGNVHCESRHWDGDVDPAFWSRPASATEVEGNEGDRWARLLPELLTEIIKRVESGEDRWPRRRSVVACACVCRQWREITTNLVGSKPQSGLITFPCSLKQPGPKDAFMQCFVKRNKKNSTFYLYLGASDTFVDKGKFLIAAKRYRSGAQIEYILSIDSDDLSQRSITYMGKLRSDFLGTKFTFFDSQPPHHGAKPPNGRSCRRFTRKQISPRVPSANFKTGQLSYQLSFLRTRSPRQMNLQLPSKEIPKSKSLGVEAPLLMKNKTPRWHEQLQCWCLNFHGRVTVASVKNFQLVEVGEEETVLLQFGKCGDNVFAMDYRYPLSAFQAFTICLTSFGMKIAVISVPRMTYAASAC